MIIAIDGPAAAGKGTLAERLAAHYGLPYLDTGLLYRLVGKLVADQGLDPDDQAATARVARALDPELLRDPALRGHEAGELASRVAVHADVRAALLDFQRRFAARPAARSSMAATSARPSARDADVKIYVTASPEVRARRRTDELRAKGRQVEFDRILAEIEGRDARDSGRAAAPLKTAADAYLLDTSDKDIETAFRAAVDIVDRAKAGAE